MRIVSKTRRLTLTLLLAFAVMPVGAQNISIEAMQALDEWRWGVVAYNDGLPGKSLLAMERAVSLNPTDPRILEWLGRAYWRSGMENAALNIWNELGSPGGGGHYPEEPHRTVAPPSQGRRKKSLWTTSGFPWLRFRVWKETLNIFGGRRSPEARETDREVC